MSRAAMILALLVPIPAVLSAQDAEDAAAALAGCYRLELGDWEPSLRPADARYHTPPGTFLLTDVPSDDARGESWMVHPVIPHGSGPRAWWEHLGGYSVRVTWNDGFTGVQLHLEAEGDSLAGTARATSDMEHAVVTMDASGDTIRRAVPSPAADATARPVPCPEWLKRPSEPRSRP